QNQLLLEELKRHCGGSGVVPASASLRPLVDSTLSGQLFDSHHQVLDTNQLEKFMTPATVNPASLSPKPDEQETSDLIKNNQPQPQSQSQPTQLVAPSTCSDSTQYPAEILPDLQCRMSQQARVPSASQAWTWNVFLMVLVSTTVSASQ